MPQNVGLKPYTHLVVLCCHAVYHGKQSDNDPRKEDNWALKPFQKGTDTKSEEHETFLQHAFAAVHLQNEHTLVAFSGGPTDAAHPGLSEARSYLNAVRAWSGKIGWTPQGVDEILLEEDATDSFQNVLFSILAFRRRTGYYPRTLTVITHAFKSDRFLDLHAKAIRWPADRVKVLGINPPFTRAELESTMAGELKNGHGPFVNDLYGTGEFLAAKRRARGWKAEDKDFGDGLEPAVQELLTYAGGAEVFPGRLPWE